MPNFKTFFAVVAILFSYSAVAQSHVGNKTTVTTVTETGFIAYNLYQKKSIISVMAKAIHQSELSVYGTPKFDNKLTIKEYRLIGAKIRESDTQEFFAYSLITPPTDTTYINARNYIGFSITYENNLFTLLIAPKKSVYLKLSEVKKVLSKNHNTFLEYHKSLLPPKKNSIPYETLFTDKQLKRTGKNLFNSVTKKLYRAGVSEKIKAYKNTTLIETFTKEELKYRGDVKTVIQVQNPENPNDVYDLIETTIINPFNADSITEIFAYHIWSNDGNGDLTLKLLACAPAYIPVINGVALLPKSLFLIADKDLQKSVVNKNVYSYLKHIFIFVIHERGAKEIDENDFEWED